jgi:hypothetical protein
MLPAIAEVNSRSFPSTGHWGLSLETLPQNGEFLLIRGHIGMFRRREKVRGRAGKRSGTELSFHCPRDTAISQTKGAGIFKAVVRHIIRHGSSEQSRRSREVFGKPTAYELESLVAYHGLQ